MASSMFSLAKGTVEGQTNRVLELRSPTLFLRDKQVDSSCS